MSLYVNVTYVLIIAFLALAGYVAGKWAFRVDTKVEARRRGYIELAAFLKEYGLVHIPEVLIAAAVGDKSGVADKVILLVELLRSNPEVVEKEFDKVFERVFSSKLLKPESLAYLKSKIAEQASA